MTPYIGAVLFTYIKVFFNLILLYYPHASYPASQWILGIFFWCRGGQECLASFNDCIHWMFAPAYHFTWKGPILVMKVNGSDGQVADCTKMDLEDVHEIIKMYVPDYFHMLIAQNFKH